MLGLVLLWGCLAACNGIDCNSDVLLKARSLKAVERQLDEAASGDTPTEDGMR